MTASSGTPRSSFLTNVLKLVSGTTLAQLITILTAPIITRLFAPEAFGLLNVFTSLVGIISVIVSLRYEYAIILPEEDGDAANVFALCWLIAFAISGLTGIVLLFAGRPLAMLLKSPELVKYLWLIPLALFLQGGFDALNYWNSRTRHFGRLSIARVAASLTTSAFPILLALIGLASTSSLVFSWMAGTLVFTSVLGIQVLKDNANLFFLYIRRSRMVTNLIRYRKFPLVDSWGGFINNLSWQLPSLMLAYFFTEKVVGYYSLSNRLIVLPMTLLGSSVSQVFYQRSAELRQNPASLTRAVGLVFRRLAAVGLFPAVVLAIAGPELFSVVFGANWSEAGRYAQILSPWMFVLFISSPLSTLFATLERQELALIVHAIILVTRFASLAIGGVTHNIFLTLVIWSGTGVLVYGGLAVWLLRLTQVSWREAGRIVLQYALLAALPALPLLVIKSLLPLSAAWLVVLTVVAALAYYLLILTRDQALRHDLLAFLPLRTTRAE